MRRRKIKFTCFAAKFFDSFGNTYHSVRVIRHKDNKTIASGKSLVHGYSDKYQQTALQLMLDAGWLPKRKVLAPANDKRKFEHVKYTKATLSMFDRENNYPITWHAAYGLKRDAVENGVL